MQVMISHNFDAYALVWLNGDKIEVRLFDSEWEADEEKADLEDREIGAPNGLEIICIRSWGM